MNLVSCRHPRSFCHFCRFINLSGFRLVAFLETNQKTVAHSETRQSLKKRSHFLRGCSESFSEFSGFLVYSLYSRCFVYLIYDFSRPLFFLFPIALSPVSLRSTCLIAVPLSAVILDRSFIQQNP